MKLNDNEAISIYEDARCLANIAIWSVKLQVQRLKSNTLEISDFEMQPIVDFHFLIISLTRLEKSAKLSSSTKKIGNNLKSFSRSLPDLTKIRNSLEHIDGEYRKGKGRSTEKEVNGLETFLIDSSKISWMDYEIDLSDAMRASESLFEAIKNNPPPAYEKLIGHNSSD